jgi:hypothetical protein
MEAHSIPGGTAMPAPSVRSRSRFTSILVALALGTTAVPSPSQATDADIQALVDQVTESRLAELIQRLQDFQTRYSASDSVGSSANWLIAQYQSFGYTDIFQHPFTVMIGGDPYPQRNIVVTKTGTTRPNEIYIIGGHYDSVSNQPFTAAPGADDDGSGTAAVLALAEILAPVDLDATVMFGHWGAEEQGFIGSQAWVSFALGEGYDIQLYMNLDACAYQGDAVRDVDLFSNAQSMPFNTTMRDLCLKYTDLIPIIVNPIPFSDHVPFQNAGFSFTYSIEEDITPFIHTPNDLLSTLDMSYCREIVQTNLASLVTFAGLTPVGISEPSPVFVQAPALRMAGRNPVDPAAGGTALALDLPAATHARVSIYDVEGRRISTLLDGIAGPGAVHLVWAGRDQRGAQVPAGVYLARLAARGRTGTVKLVVTP